MFGKRNSSPRGGLAIALLLSVFSGIALAEKADKDKPINLEADRVNIDDAKKVSVFEGNVVLTQGTLQIRADRMVVREDAQGFSYGVAYGNLVMFRQKREGVDEYVEGQAERIEYDGKAERVQLFNRAQMRRGGDEIRGSYISYDQPTEFFRVTGAPDDQAGKPGAGRVRAIIQPKNKDKDKPRETAPPLQLKPAPALTEPKK